MATAKPVIDVSYAQQTINFTKVKNAGINDVIIRNGYLGKTDTFFDQNVQNAVANGLNIGTYTYIISQTVEQARTEAKETVSRLEKYKGYINYPVFCDIEDQRFMNSKFNNRIRTDIVLAFCETVRKAGYYVAVYTNPAWLETYLYKDEILGKYDIWLAAWTNSASKPTRFNYNQTMWQWGVSAVDGITNPVDSNLVYVDYPAIIKKANLNYLVQLKPDKIQNVTYIMKSLGKAAVRNGCSKDSTVLGRVATGDYYFADQIITKGEDGSKWFRHKGTQSYSMVADGGKLFSTEGQYDSYTVNTASLNARDNPSLSGNKVAVLKQGEKVLVFKNYSTKKDNFTWFKAVYNGKIIYVASRYLTKVSV